MKALASAAAVLSGLLIVGCAIPARLVMRTRDLPHPNPTEYVFHANPERVKRAIESGAGTTIDTD